MKKQFTPSRDVRINVMAVPHQGQVVIKFDQPITWFALKPDLANKIAMDMMKCAQSLVVRK
jgi:hypothetical protein